MRIFQILLGRQNKTDDSKESTTKEIKLINKDENISGMNNPIVLKYDGIKNLEAIDVDIDTLISMKIEGKVFSVYDQKNQNGRTANYWATREHFVILTNQGYSVNFLNFPKEEFNKILRYDKSLLKRGHIRGLPRLSEGNGWCSMQEDILHNLLKKFVDYFRVNEREISELEEDVMIEFLSIVPIFDLEWFKSLIQQINNKYYCDIIIRLYERMMYSSGRRSRTNYYRLHFKKKEAIKIFEPYYIVKAYYKMDQLWEQPTRKSIARKEENFYTDDVLQEMFKQYPKEMYKIGSKIQLDDELILQILEVDLGFYGSLILDKIKPETGRRIMEMSKSGYAFESLPLNVLEANKDLVVSILKEFPNRIEQIGDNKIKQIIVSWLNNSK